MGWIWYAISMGMIGMGWIWYALSMRDNKGLQGEDRVLIGSKESKRGV
jgi:hypothetical protein